MYPDEDAKVQLFADAPVTTPRTLRERTIKKRLHYESRGFRLVETWECEFKSLRRQRPEVEAYCKPRFEYFQLLALYGGGVDIDESFYGGL